MSRRTRGFTLIEAMVAIVLLVVGILAVAQAFTASIFANQKAKNLTIAQNAITLRFEQMRNTGFDLLQSKFPGNFSVTDPDRPGKVVGTGQVTMQRLGQFMRVMKVTISVTVGSVRGSMASLTSISYIAET